MIELNGVRFQLIFNWNLTPINQLTLKPVDRYA